MIKMISKLIIWLRGYEQTFNNELLSIHETDFNIMLKSGKRKSKIFKTEFGSLINYSYGFVKIDLIDLMKQGLFTEVIKRAFKEKKITLTDSDINRYNHNDLLAFILWIRDELEAILNLERRELGSDPNPDLMASGVHELDKLGEINVIDSIAKGNVLRWGKIKQLPYYTIFEKQLKTVIEDRINKRLNKILSKKK